MSVGDRLSKPVNIGSSTVYLNDLIHRIVLWVIVLTTAALVLLPFVYALSVSFRTPAEFFSSPHWIVKNPTLAPWETAIDEIGPQLKNSIIIGLGVATLALIITIPGAYVFGRKEFPGKKPLFYLIVTALMFPYILLVIPLVDLWNDIGLYNTIPGLWLADQVFVTPFAIWILRDFFSKLPQNLEESAMVYGCTQFQAFRKVILPLATPAIVAVAFVAFLVGWNDFLFSNLLTTGSGPRPAVVTLFITTTGGERQYWATVMAETLMVGIPPAVLYLFARRYLTNAFAV